MKQLRTITKAFEEYQLRDPDTALTLYALNCLVKSGEIRSFEVGKKRLIDVDSIDEYLAAKISRESKQEAPSKLKRVL